MLKSLSFLSMFGQKNDVAIWLWLEWSIAHFSVIYWEVLFKQLCWCRGGDALTSHGYKLSKQQDQLHLVFRWWNCNLRERQHWTLQRDKIAFLIDLMEKSSLKKIKKISYHFSLALNSPFSDASYIIGCKRNRFMWTTINLISICYLKNTIQHNKHMSC